MPVKSSGRLFEHPLNEYKSIQVTRLIQDYHDADPRRGFYGGGGIDARFDFCPAGFAISAMPADMPSWGIDFKRRDLASAAAIA